jgi:hypothetical protein
MRRTATARKASKERWTRRPEKRGLTIEKLLLRMAEDFSQ